MSCCSFAANAVRFQLHALAYNLGNFLRTLATPEPIKDWSLTSLKDKLTKIGTKVVSHGRYVVQSLQLDAGVGGFELPGGLGVVLVAVVLPCVDFVGEDLLIGDASTPSSDSAMSSQLPCLGV